MLRSKLTSAAAVLALMVGASLALPSMASAATKDFKVPSATKEMRSPEGKGLAKRHFKTIAETPVMEGRTVADESLLIKRPPRLSPIRTAVDEAPAKKPSGISPILETRTRADESLAGSPDRTAALKPLKIKGGKKIAKAKEESPAPTRVIRGEEALLVGVDADTDAALRLRRIR